MTEILKFTVGSDKSSTAYLLNIGTADKSEKHRYAKKIIEKKPA